jgi:hypothetical protein
MPPLSTVNRLILNVNPHASDSDAPFIVLDFAGVRYAAANLYDGFLKPPSFTYEKGAKYRQGWFIIRDGILYSILQDFTSDDTAGNTINESLQTDISAGNIKSIGGGIGMIETYTHAQAIPMPKWQIQHNLGGTVEAIIKNASGERVLNEIIETTSNLATIEFDNPTAGEAVIYKIK